MSTNLAHTEIRARIGDGAIDKITRMFPDSLAGVFIELLQNGRRAGAANVSVRIHNACRQVIAEGGSQAIDPAVRLMVTQPAYLTGANKLPHAGYQALLDTCRARAAAKENRDES